MRKCLISMAMGWLLCSCGFVQKSTLHGLKDGYYSVKSGKKSAGKVYAVVDADSILIYPVNGKQVEADRFDVIPVPPQKSKTRLPDRVLSKWGFDLDISTVLFKYRPSNRYLPGQLNSNLNLALYLGYKKESYRFSGDWRPAGYYRSSLQNFSVDAGLFTGLGSVAMNPSVTGGRISSEYDGLVWQKGAALFLGWENFTFGVGLGFDGLMNNDRKYWIYQEKPWVGLMIGLALSN